MRVQLSRVVNDLLCDIYIVFINLIIIIYFIFYINYLILSHMLNKYFFHMRVNIMKRLIFIFKVIKDHQLKRFLCVTKKK